MYHLLLLKNGVFAVAFVDVEYWNKFYVIFHREESMSWDSHTSRIKSTFWARTFSVCLEGMLWTISVSFNVVTISCIVGLWCQSSIKHFDATSIQVFTCWQYTSSRDLSPSISWSLFFQLVCTSKIRTTWSQDDRA